LVLITLVFSVERGVSPLASSLPLINILLFNGIAPKFDGKRGARFPVWGCTTPGRRRWTFRTLAQGPVQSPAAPRAPVAKAACARQTGGLAPRCHTPKICAHVVHQKRLHAAKCFYLFRYSLEKSAIDFVA
jgi:hypothetical protein